MNTTSAIDPAPSALARLSVWAASGLLAAATLGAYEAYVRAEGVRPSVVDDRELWSVVRGRATGPAATLALCGASRIQLAFDPATAREAEPGLRCVQLAIDGTNAVAALRDLADDPDFRGTALLSLLPGSLAYDVWEDQEPWVRRRKAGFTLDASLNRAWRAELQERLALLAPEAEVRRVIKQRFGRRAPPEQRMVMLADRSRTASYAGLDREDYAARRLARDRAGISSSPQGEDYERWLRAVDDVDAMTRRVVARGGRVVLFHDLLSGAYRDVHRAAFPRERYWDVVVARSSAICVAAEDVPEIARLTCPDGSHVDGKDAPAFTRALLAELRRRGALP